MDRDVQRARAPGEAARSAAAPVEGVDGDVARAARASAASRSSCGGGRERAVEQQRPAAGPSPVTRQPMASPPGRASSPAALAGEQRADGLAAQLAARRARQGVEAHERAGTLNPASGRATWAASASSPGSVGARRAGRSRPPGRGPRSRPGGRRRRPRRRPGGPRRTASTSAGAMFSPPRTIRSTRRSTTIRRPCRVEAAEVAGADGLVGRRRGRRLAQVAGEARRPVATTISPTPSASGVRDGDARRRGAGGPPIPGGPRASAVGSAVTPEPISVRP